MLHQTQITRYWLLAVFMTTSVSLANAATKAFVVTEASYGVSSGYFRCDAKLDEDDNATLVITVPNDESDSVLSTIHAKTPVTISTVAVGAKDTRIDIKATGTSGDHSIVTYVRRFDLASAYGLRHVVRIDDEQQARLASSIVVKNMSGSTAEWDNANLSLKIPGAPLEFPVTMSALETFSILIGLDPDYDVLLEEVPDSVLRSKGTVAYQLSKLTNRGNQLIKAGSLQVMQGDCLLFASDIEADLAIGKSTHVLRVPVDKKLVKVETNSETDRWHQSVELVEGILKIQPHSANHIKVTNSTENAISIYLEKELKALAVEPGKTKSEFLDEKSNGDVVSTDLLNLDAAMLKKHVDRLPEIEKSKPSGDLNRIKQIQGLLKRIQEADAKMNALNQSVSAVRGRINDLADGQSNDGILARLTVRLSLLNGEIKTEASSRQRHALALANELFPIASAPVMTDEQVSILPEPMATPSGDPGF